MSRAGKPVSFPFYGQDWLADDQVRELSWDERGVYVELLCWCHAQRGLPVDPERLRKRLKLSPRVWKRMWISLEPFFPVDLLPAVRMNPKMLTIIEEQDRYREQKSAAGRASGAKRANGRSPAVGTGRQRDGNSPLPLPSPRDPPTPRRSHPVDISSTIAEVLDPAHPDSSGGSP